jgi:hypothetical protein
VTEHRLCPQQLAGTHLEVNDGVTTLVGPIGDRYVLNETASALWELCDGETASDEMVAAICLLFDAGEAVITADVQRTLREFEHHHLVEWVDNPDFCKERA